MNLAGKFSPEMRAMLGVGALTAGASTLGNVVTGQAQDKGPGRVALEALGAGVLGGAVGHQIPKVSQFVADETAKPYFRDPRAATAVKRGAELGIGAVTLGAGGLGGLVGGGVANAAGMVGIPGMQSNYVDPEGYGSSNSQMSRPMYKQTTASAPTRYYS
jgi:hypothetical protein